MNRFYFAFIITLLCLNSCSPKVSLTSNNIIENYISFINNKNPKYTNNLFLSENERNLVAKKFGVDTSDLIQCPISKNPDDLMQYINECIGFEKELNKSVEYDLLQTKRTINNKCSDLKVEFVYCDLLENNRISNKHIILFVIPVKNKSYKLFGHKYYEDF